MLPRKRAQIMARAWECGRNRLIGGIHYPSDIEVGRIAGTVLSADDLDPSGLQSEFAPTRPAC
jgi:acid phosphatase (class A)